MKRPLPKIDAPSRQPWRPAVIVGVLGGLVGLVLSVSVLANSGHDPYVFAAVGSDGNRAQFFADVAGRPVVTRPGPGHDGQMFFVLALDPTVSGSTPDHLGVAPMYRAQRIVMPLLAGLGGLLPDRWVIWSFPILHILALSAGSLGTARLAQHLGVSPWCGLGFAFNPGLLMAVLIGGAGIIAFAFAVWATLALEKGRVGMAGALMAASVLTRETMFFYLAGLCLVLLYRTRKIPWRLGLPPTVVFVAWLGYLTTRVPLSTYGSGNQAISYPFGGLIEAAGAWHVHETEDLVLFVAIFASLFAAVLLTPKFIDSYVGATTAMFLFLSTIMGAGVWRQSFDAARGIAPVFTALVLMAMLDRRRETATTKVSTRGLAGSAT